jgi:hypothetical protein
VPSFAHASLFPGWLTRRPLALGLLRLFAAGVLAADGVGMLDLVGSRHDGGSARLGESIGGVNGQSSGAWEEGGEDARV